MCWNGEHSHGVWNQLQLHLLKLTPRGSDNHLETFLCICVHAETFQQSHGVMYGALWAINTASKQPTFSFIFLLCTRQTTCRPYGAVGILSSKTGTFSLYFSTFSGEWWGLLRNWMASSSLYVFSPLLVSLFWTFISDSQLQLIS